MRQAFIFNTLGSWLDIVDDVFGDSLGYGSAIRMTSAEDELEER